MVIADDGAETLKEMGITEVLGERNIHAANIPGLMVKGKGIGYAVSPIDCPPDAVYLRFHDALHTTVHLEAVSLLHETGAHPEEFKRDLLYSRTGDDKRLITASGFRRFEGPVKVVSDKEETLEPHILQIIRGVDFFHVRARSKESGLDDAYEMHIKRIMGEVAVPITLAEAMGVYDAIIKVVPRDYSF